MRIGLLILLICKVSSLDSQIYMRKKQNIGFYTQGNFKNAQIDNMGFGVTRLTLKYFEPEIGVRTTFPLATESNLFTPKHFYLDGALNIRKSLCVLNERKKGRSCRGEVLEIFVAPEYHILLKNSTARNDIGQGSIRAGLGLFHYQTGFSKRNKTYTLKIQCYYRWVPGPKTVTQTIGNEWGVQLRLFKFKTYDFVK
ncbi:MAG: hypothetical protein EBR91_08375 [Flavobacteriia bacterium]|nr:hypothetical protein [Flavobacteriia bacterium]NBV92169.1 hypothetical protein [Flavobacteriia bacterium]NBY41061.1 hypothetical protein [Flavobacteriia bacterium]